MADETVPTTEEARKAAKRREASERMRAWRAKPENRERERVRRLAHYDPVIAKERQKRWKENNPAAYRAMMARAEAKRTSATRKPTRQHWMAAHREEQNAKRREWIAKDPERHRAVTLRYRANNRAKIAAAARLKRTTDIQHHLAAALRDRIRGALRGQRRVASAVKDLGCSITEFRRHIERQFTKGMSWDNWGFGRGKWNLDHIRPLASFDLTNPDQFRAAVHFTNYQPLWHIDNVKKGATLEVLL